MGNFMDSVKDTLNGDNHNVSVTENGAVGYRTTGKDLLDLNFAVASLRNASEKEIAKRFSKAFFEDKLTAMKWLFYARDVRGGLGERRLFRAVLLDMAKTMPEYIKPLLMLVPEYGRWDDLWCLLDTPLAEDVMHHVSMQLTEDNHFYEQGQPISLLAKWMPRCKCRDKNRRRYAKMLREYLNLTERDYQHTLSALCRHLQVVEMDMSAQNWDGIDYQRVPSRANLVYNKAFLRHDEERRRAFLESVKKGESRINAGTLFPHEIVNKYRNVCHVDDTLEVLWSNLPDTVAGCGNTMVVMDDSGSMEWVTLPGSTARPLEVANAMAIYFAERSSGQFKDQYMSFSDRPQLLSLRGGRNLYEKLRIAHNHHTGANTNVEAVFDLILETAKSNHMEQADLPTNILIISDMEFDACATAGEVRGNGWSSYSSARPSANLFKVISKRYEAAGYKMPRLVFWNVASRTGTIPVKENDMGVALVSGFSVNIAKMVMSGKLDPYDCLLETINAERYQPVEDALRLS